MVEALFRKGKRQLREARIPACDVAGEEGALRGQQAQRLGVVAFRQALLRALGQDGHEVALEAQMVFRKVQALAKAQCVLLEHVVDAGAGFAHEHLLAAFLVVRRLVGQGSAPAGRPHAVERPRVVHGERLACVGIVLAQELSHDGKAVGDVLSLGKPRVAQPVDLLLGQGSREKQRYQRVQRTPLFHGRLKFCRVIHRRLRSTDKKVENAPGTRRRARQERRGK